jgi:hypothetical protein
MASRRTTHGAATTWLVVMAVLVAACGTGPASPSPAAQGTPTRAADPSTAASSTVGSPVAGLDPIANLSIAAPYTFEPLDAAQAAQIQQIQNGLGAMATIVQIGARMVKKSDTSAGLLLGMAFPGVPLDSAALVDSVVGGAAGKAGGTMTTRTIGGQQVRLVEGPTTSIAGYPRAGTIVLAYGRSLSEAVGIITAVIDASE